MPIMLSLMLLATGLAETAATAPLGTEPDAQRMSVAEIRANNATLERSHPYYIRCQSRDETGSLAKKIRSCRTNRQWAQAFVIGNQNARDTYEAMTSKAADGQH